VYYQGALQLRVAASYISGTDCINKMNAATFKLLKQFNKLIPKETINY
jgi:hypothetical protein